MRDFTSKVYGDPAAGMAACPQVRSVGIPLLGMLAGTIIVNRQRLFFLGQQLVGGGRVLDQQGNSLPASDAS